MEKDDWRFSLSAEKYLEKTHVMVYLEDAISQLLDHKDDNPKVNPNSFFLKYFASVKAGNHVLLREFSFVTATLHNRSSFVRAFWKCFCNIGRKGDPLCIREYHALASIVCSDFPLMLFQKTAKIILMDAATEDSLISFIDFIYAFQLQLCFDEFLTKSSEVYGSLLQNPAASHLDAVVVPTSENRPLQTTVEASKNDRSNHDVDAMQFYRALLAACEQLDISIPPVNLLREILSEKDRITFYGFLTSFSKSEKLNETIGKLPQRSELFTMTEQEMNLAPTPATEKFIRADDFVITSPVTTQTVPGVPTSATKFLEPQNAPSKDVASSTQSSRGRPPGSSRSESVKSAEPGRWVSSVGVQDGFSTPGSSAAKSRSSAFRRSSSSTRQSGNSSRKKRTKSRTTALSSSGTDNDDDDDVDDDLNSDASLSSRN